MANDGGSRWAVPAGVGLLLLGALVAIAVSWWTPWVVVPCVFLIGSRQHALFVLAHDAAHYRLFASRALNDFAGRACATPAVMKSDAAIANDLIACSISCLPVSFFEPRPRRCFVQA